MKDELDESLRSIFSVLPPEQAEDARRRSLEGMFGNEVSFNVGLKWANFDRSGRFLNGTVSDLAGQRTAVVRQAAEDEDIARLVALARDGGAIPGRMEFSLTRNQAYWFVPWIDRRGNRAAVAMRGFSLPEALFGELCDLFNADLTSAERRLAFHLLGGLSLKESAAADGVAHETRRSQLKALTAKLQCGGQSDVIRLLTSQLGLLQSVAEQSGSSTGALERFVDRHCMAATRIQRHRLAHGRRLTVLEIGLPEGRPVLFLHGMMWPLLLTRQIDAIERHRLRILMPLRPGYCEESSLADVYGKSHTIADWLCDVAALVRDGYGPGLPVVGHSYGAVFALLLAARFPDSVRSLHILSMNPGQSAPSPEGFARRLFAGLRSVGHKPGMFRFLTWQFKRYYADEKTVGGVLHRLFGASEADRGVLAGGPGAARVDSWFVPLFQSSIPGIADDFATVLGPWADQWARSEQNVHLIHGTEDPVVDVEEIVKLVGRARIGHLDRVEGAGHHALASHPDAVWDAVVSQADRAAP